jgi:predicted porin
MNKKLIAVAVAAAFAAPMAASADATIYGDIHTSVQFTDAELNNTTVQDNIEVVGNDGALGIKGSEDLGNGLKGIYKFEINFGGDDGSISGTADEVYVGLASSWGAVAIGRDDHPYKDALNASGYNPFGDKILDLDAVSSDLGGMGFRQETTSNAVKYISPNWSGFSFTGAIVAPEGSGATGDPLNDSFDAYSLGANYAGGGLKVGVAYENIDVFQNADGPKSWVIAGSYTFGGLTVGAAYEQTDDAAQFTTNNATNLNFVAEEVETLGLSVNWVFGNNEIGGMYVMEEQSDIGASGSGLNADIDSWGITAAHNLSNRTQVYVAYADSENDGTPAAVGANPRAIWDDASAFSLGVVHSF